LELVGQGQTKADWTAWRNSSMDHFNKESLTKIVLVGISQPFYTLVSGATTLSITTLGKTTLGKIKFSIIINKT
jgi:hypothetical protein